MRNRTLLLEALAVGLVLILVGWAMWASQARKSATVDEPDQLWAGALILTRGDYSINPHPPLTKLLQALPVVLLGARVPADYRPTPGPFSDIPGGRRFLYRNQVPHGRLLAAGRAVNIGIALLFLLAGYLLARRLYGVGGGALTLALLAADPNLAAHGRLATTDLAATAFPVLALAVLGWALEAPTRRRLLLAGLALGLGLSGKLSGVYLLAAVPMACLAAGTGSWGERLRRAAPVLAVGVLVVVAQYGVVNAGEYVRGLRQVVGDRWEQPFYLLGEVRTSGWWRYVPVVAAVKLPHAHQALALAVLISLLRRRPSPAERPLLIGAGLVVAGVLVAPINIGVRHLVPALCMLALLAGRLVVDRPRLAVGLVLGVLVGSGVGVARSWPDFLAYYNEAAGGPAAGHELVIDTNLDMGQDLAGLARWVEQRRLPGIYLCYFGSADPRALGLPYRWVPDDRNDYLAPGLDLPPGSGRRYLAISPTYLYLYRDRAFEWLQRRRPVAVIGHTIRIYDITGDREAAERLAALYQAAGLERQADQERRRALGLRGN